MKDEDAGGGFNAGVAVDGRPTVTHEETSTSTGLTRSKTYKRANGIRMMNSTCIGLSGSNCYRPLEWKAHGSPR